VEDWAGQFGVQGSVDGVGQAARFQFVSGMTSHNGYLYVSADHAIRRIEIATATVTTWAGQSGTQAHVDDSGGAARFDGAVGLATNGTKLWVADAGNAVIREIDIATVQVSTIAGQVGVNGNADGSGAAATFDAMRELAYDGTYLYLIEAGSASVLRRIDPSNGAVVTLAGSYNNQGLADGTGNAARFAAPRFVTAIGANNLYVGDTENHRPRHVDVVGNQGVVSSPYGSSQGYQDGNGTSAQFDRLRGVAYDGANLIIADSDNFCIRLIDLQTDEVTTIAGMAQVNNHVVDVGTAAGFDKPLDLHYDADTGDVFISEGAVIRRFYYQ